MWTTTRRLLGSVKAWIIGLGALAGAVGAVLALVFIFFPGLRPCFGDATAEFQDVDVTKVASLEADLSYTVETHGYEGKGLRVVWSLLKAGPDGVLTPVPGFVRLPGATLKPTSCSSDQGGADIRVAVVESGSYKIVLELLPPGNAARITRTTADIKLL